MRSHGGYKFPEKGRGRDSMGKSQDDMNRAAAAWLESHNAYKKFLVDSQVMYEIFASTWQGPRRGLTEAFDSYREALLRENGYSHSEVRAYYPNRKPNAD